MKSGQAKSMRKAAAAAGQGRFWLVAALLGCAALASGCITQRRHVKDGLMADLHSHQRHEGVVECYRVGCPDLLLVEAPAEARLGGRLQIAPDGRLDLGEHGNVRVDGRATTEVAQLIAEQLGVDDDSVKVVVAEYNSQHLLLFGEVFGWQRTVPYQGQETVLDVLQRVGGITPAAAPDSVYVVRSHVSDGQRPEVFHVDLNAIVLKKDYRTNIRVQPFDQIYVGETRQARFEKSLPLWLRPVLHTVAGQSITPEAGEAFRRQGAWRRHLNGSHLPEPSPPRNAVEY
jgi:protein involved in polysaccharide export with SLBB domain